MTASTSIVTEATLAASSLSRHPHDHGWRELYRVIAHAFEQSATLGRLAREFHAVRPMDSSTHFVTLLGIAVKAAAPKATRILTNDHDLVGRMRVLDRVIEQHDTHIRQTMLNRQNSFTCARRFLVPQVLLAAYFGSVDQVQVRFADLGTGLGILPRQLNNRELFERFAGDLAWPDGVPRFARIPLISRCGVDRGPSPDLSWVRACYGASAYYDNLLQELVESIDVTQDAAGHVSYESLDLLDSDGLAALLRRRAINAANLSYVLYELRPVVREHVIETALRAMKPPGVIVVIEPRNELAGPGCAVTVYGHGHDPLRVLGISDGHFRGTTTPAGGYDEFLSRFSVDFGPGAR